MLPRRNVSMRPVCGSHVYLRGLMKLAWLRGSLGFLAFTAAALPAAAQTPAATETAPAPAEQPALPAEPSPTVEAASLGTEAPPPPAELKWYEPVATPVKVETPVVSARLGILLQPQFESVGSPAL